MSRFAIRVVGLECLVDVTDEALARGLALHQPAHDERTVAEDRAPHSLRTERGGVDLGDRRPGNMSSTVSGWNGGSVGCEALAYA